MPEPGPSPDARGARRFRRGLLGIGVAGFVGRLVAVATIGRVDPTGGDGFYYHQQANFLAQGRWFVDPYIWRTTGQFRPGNAHPPLWTVWLSISSLLGGTDYRAHKTMACLAGVLLVVGVGLLGRELAGRRAGLIAAGLAAAYPPFWIIDGLLMPEELYAATVAFLALAALRWLRRPNWASAAALGAMLAVSSLTRAEVIALAVLLVAPIMLLRRQLPWRARIGQLAVCGAACALVLGPWVVRNALSFNRFEPFSTNGDELFVYGNNPVAYGTDTSAFVCATPNPKAPASLGPVTLDATHGTFVGYWSFRWEDYLRCLKGEPKGDVSDKALYWRHEGVSYARSHLGRLPVVALARVGRTWEVYRPFQTAYFDKIEGRKQWVSDLGLWAYWALLAAAAYGLVLLRRRKVPVWPLLSLAALVTVTVLYAYGSTRFRLPLDVAIVAGAAVAADGLLRRRGATVTDVGAFEADAASRGTVPVAGGAPAAVDVARALRRLGLRVRAWPWRSIAVVAVVVAAVVVALRGLLLHPGAPMEEGFMLVFPERVLHGAVPNRDFLHLYGPGSLWFLAAGYWLFGTSVATERFLGLLQLSGIIAAVVLLARPFGRWLAAICGLSCVLLVLPPLGLTALAWNGAVALAGLAVVLALQARRSPGADGWSRDLAVQPGPGDDVAAWAATPRTRRLLLAAGLVGGLALTFRPDLVVALGLGLGAALWTVRRVVWRRALAGLALGASPVLLHVAIAGPRAVVKGLIVEPVFRLRAGRALPVPPSFSHIGGFLQRAAQLRPLGWPLPHLRFAGQVWVWFWLVPLAAVLLLVAGAAVARRDPAALRGSVLLAAGALSVGMLPQAFQRADSTHFAWASCISLSLLPVALAELLRLASWRPVAGRATAVGGLAAAVVLALVLPLLTTRPYLDYVRQSFGRDRFGWSIRNGDRTFSYGSPEIAAAGNQLVADLAPREHRGQRLFVGPLDLRRTPYSQAFWYFLFPDLVPATRYIELDPGIANRAGSSLAADVHSADWLILTTVGAGWEEPNTSTAFGSDAPNQVVRREFCLVDAYGRSSAQPDGIWRLYQRCPTS